MLVVVFLFLVILMFFSYCLYIADNGLGLMEYINSKNNTKHLASLLMVWLVILHPKKKEKLLLLQNL